jgi:hypothetical protein
MEHPGSHWTDFPFNLVFEYISKNVSKKLKIHETVTGITDNLHEDVCMYVTWCRWSLLRMRNFTEKKLKRKSTHLYHHHLRHVHEVLGLFPVPWSSVWCWSLHLFLGRPLFLRPFGLYCSPCFGILFVSIPCTCCSHFSWYCSVSFTMLCAPVFSPIHWHTHLYVHKFYLENRAVYEIIKKKYCITRQITVRCVRTACWTPEATNTHTEYVILIAFSLQRVARTLLSVT